MIPRWLVALTYAAILFAAVAAFAKGHGGHHSNYCVTCARDSSGHIKRDPEVRREFEANHPCPSTGRPSGACPGYVVDHVIPLKRGGPDATTNMQWQTIEEGKAKDAVE